MKKKNVWIICIAVCSVFVVYGLYTFFDSFDANKQAAFNILFSSLTAITAIIGVFCLIYQLSQAQKVNSAQFLTTLSQMYIENKEYQLLLAELEGNNNKLTPKQEQIAANCLDFFEPFYIHLDVKSFRMDQIDDLFCYRFFAIVNNPEVQERVICPHYEYYSNIAKLHRDWKSFRKKANKKIPLEETDLSEQSWYKEII